MASRFFKTICTVGLSAMLMSTGCVLIVDEDDPNKKPSDNNWNVKPCDAAKTSDGSCDMTCKDVDPDCTAPTTCGDGTQATCKVLPPECPSGLVLEVVNNCYGECVDPNTCQAPMGCGDGQMCPQGYSCKPDPLGDCDLNTGKCNEICIKDQDPQACGDGTQLACRRAAPDCPSGTIAEVEQGCYTDRCVDPKSCEPVKRMCNAKDAVCKRIAPECPEGTVAEVDEETLCYTDRCLDVLTCQVVASKPPCHDDSQVICDAEPPRCPGNLVPELKNGCWGACVDPETCQAPKACGVRGGVTCEDNETCVDVPDDGCDPNNGGADCPGVCVEDKEPETCGDGTQALCEILPPSCPRGLVREVVNNCYGECVDPKTCKPPQTDERCGDGSVLTCRRAEPVCPDGLIAEIVNGCYGKCVDKATCKAPPMCGGIAGLKCDSGLTCVDDPTDGCDPNNGGSDCSGICVKQDSKTCGDGTQLMCRRVAPDCPRGTIAEIVNGCYSDFCVDPATCLPQARTCSVDGTQPTCLAPQPVCAKGTTPQIANSCYTGKCVDQYKCQEPRSCGGFVGAICDRDQICSDVPNDGCDPGNGGADCVGVCVYNF